MSNQIYTAYQNLPLYPATTQIAEIIAIIN
jgi:hypothetical protein